MVYVDDFDEDESVLHDAGLDPAHDPVLAAPKYWPHVEPVESARAAGAARAAWRRTLGTARTWAS